MGGSRQGKMGRSSCDDVDCHRGSGIGPARSGTYSWRNQCYFGLVKSAGIPNKYITRELPNDRPNR